MNEDSGELPRPGPLSLEQLKQLVQRYLPLLRSYVRMNLGAGLDSKESVSDLVQSTVRQICGTQEQVVWVNEDAFKGWLYTCVFRKVIEKRTFWNRQKRDREREQTLESGDIPVSLHAQTPSAIVIRGEQLERLQRAFDQLDPLDRQLFAQAYIFSLPLVQIANEVGMPESTVRDRLRKLQVRLASILGSLD